MSADSHRGFWIIFINPSITSRALSVYPIGPPSHPSIPELSVSIVAIAPPTPRIRNAIFSRLQLSVISSSVGFMIIIYGTR